MVEGKLRLVSQCSDAFLAAVGGFINKITTAHYTIQEQGSVVTVTTASDYAGSSTELDVYPDVDTPTEDTAIIAVANNNNFDKSLSMQVDDTRGQVKVLGAPLRLAAGLKNLDLDNTTGSLTLPGHVVNTAIADLSAAAGQLWLSSTDVDNLKYSSASTLYTIHSTKGDATNATAAAPSLTASATSVMMACGGAITPANTGRVLITASGQLANATINDGATVDLRYGTGTPPVNGAAVSGTLVGIAQTQTSLVAAAKSGFCISGVVTGLTLGTAIWIDLSLKAVTGGNATVTGVSISAVEI